jgi:hypothetical protein
LAEAEGGASGVYTNADLAHAGSVAIRDHTVSPFSVLPIVYWSAYVPRRKNGTSVKAVRLPPPSCDLRKRTSVGAPCSRLPSPDTGNLSSSAAFGCARAHHPRGGLGDVAGPVDVVKGRQQRLEPLGLLVLLHVGGQDHGLVAGQVDVADSVNDLGQRLRLVLLVAAVDVVEVVDEDDVHILGSADVRWEPERQSGVLNAWIECRGTASALRGWSF